MEQVCSAAIAAGDECHVSYSINPVHDSGIGFAIIVFLIVLVVAINAAIVLVSKRS